MIKQFIPQEYCLKCRVCCRFSEEGSIWSPILLDGEMDKLLEHRIPPSFFSYDKRIRLQSQPRQDNFTCSFFDSGDNKCKIYDLRPFECQLYPFLLNRDSNAIFLALDLRCPFIQQNLQPAVFQEYAKDIVDFLNSPEGQALLKNNPQLIQEYPGVLNVAELYEVE